MKKKARRGLVSVQDRSIVDLDADSTAWRTQNASRLDEFDACLLNEKAISDKTTTEKAESENVVAEGFSAQQATEKVVVGKGRRGESGYRCEDEAHTNTATVQQDAPVSEQ